MDPAVSARNDSNASTPSSNSDTCLDFPRGTQGTRNDASLDRAHAFVRRVAFACRLPARGCRSHQCRIAAGALKSPLAREALFTGARMRKIDASALDAELRDRMEKRALDCAKGYTPGVFDGNDQIREKLTDRACFANADAQLRDWLLERYTAMFGGPAIGTARIATRTGRHGAAPAAGRRDAIRRHQRHAPRDDRTLDPRERRQPRDGRSRCASGRTMWIASRRRRHRYRDRNQNQHRHRHRHPLRRPTRRLQARSTYRPTRRYLPSASTRPPTACIRSAARARRARCRCS